jgi:transcriptional regulator with XRE-family HTH domain
MESLRSIFGSRVRTVREARGWSQEQLGKAAGLGGKYVGIIERGEKSATFAAVEKLATALEVDCYELFVPTNRRTAAVARHVKALLDDAARIDVGAVEDFLKALAGGLHKLDRRGRR